MLSPSSPLLRHLALLSLLLLLQKLLLLLGVHLAEAAVALLLLELLGLHAAFLGLLLVVDLAQLAGLVVAGGADFAQGFGAEVRGADEVVGHAQEGGEERGRGGLGVEAHGEVDALAGDQVVESGEVVSGVFSEGSVFVILLGGVDRLVSNDQSLEIFASIRNSLDEVRCEHGLGDLGALAHDSGPVRELGVVLGRGQGDVVALVTEGPHLVLVDNGKDEAIVSRVLASGSSRKESLLLSIEAVGGGLDPFGRRGHAVGEEGHGGLAEPRERVVALVQRDPDVQPRDVLSSGAVRDVLALALLLEHVLRDLGAARNHFGQAIRLDVGDASVLAAVKADAGVLAVEHGQVGGGPLLCARAVCACANDVDNDDDQDDRDDHELLVEVGESGALPDAVPCSVGAVLVDERGGSAGGSGSTGRNRRGGMRGC
jgi:hypothetical protein